MGETPQDKARASDPQGVPDAPGRHAAPEPSATPAPPTPPATSEATRIERTRAAATWTGLVIGIVVAVLLLIFILQNLESVTFQLFAWEFTLPAGISLLIAAIAGALIMAMAGAIRIVQIRRVAKRAGAVPDHTPPGSRGQ